MSTWRCLVCGQEKEYANEGRFFDEGWWPSVWLDGKEVGPVCPKHEVEMKTEVRNGVVVDERRELGPKDAARARPHEPQFVVRRQP